MSGARFQKRLLCERCRDRIVKSGQHWCQPCKDRESVIQKERAIGLRLLDKKTMYVKKKYRLSKSQFVRLIAYQKGTCAICKRKPEEGLVVDHSHDAGFVRGLLCGPCNYAIPEPWAWKWWREAAFEYLDQPPALRCFGKAIGMGHQTESGTDPTATTVA